MSLDTIFSLETRVKLFCRGVVSFLPEGAGGWLVPAAAMGRGVATVGFPTLRLCSLLNLHDDTFSDMGCVSFIDLLA